ncbi:MAG: Uma2 family endonuclease [Crocosphaera sp.]|nr:Uma2 family endonuclease [Crocosphaera sp.]
MQVISKTNEIPLRLWTVEDYHRMVETGILQPDEPVELIAGQIIQKMSPQGTPHAATIRIVSGLLEKCLGKQVLVQTQLPIQLNNFSEPEPDIALIVADELRYLDHHPFPSEVYLIVEIADSTIKRDCQIKALDYGSSGIKDYWVLDINNRCLHVFRKGTEKGYEEEMILQENESVSLLEFSDINIKVSEMLPPNPKNS